MMMLVVIWLALNNCLLTLCFLTLIIFSSWYALTQYCAVCNPDVRITPGRRQQLVRTWE
jgi:hypothetical protein